MDSKSPYRGLLVTLLSVVLGVLALLALPRAVARYVVPALFLVAAGGIAIFSRDFHRALRG